MADRKISELPKASTIIDTDKFLLEQDSQAKMLEAYLFRQYAEIAGRNAAGQLKQGDKGEKGETGNGIVSIAKTAGTSAPGTFDTYTISYTDIPSQTMRVYNGADGAAGVFTATATLLANAWTAEWEAGDVWIQYVDVPGLLSSDQPIMSYDFPSGTGLGVQSAIKEEWNVLRSWTGDGRLAVRMIGKPTHEIMIRLFCVRA